MFSLNYSTKKKQQHQQTFEQQQHKKKHLPIQHTWILLTTAPIIEWEQENEKR